MKRTLVFALLLAGCASAGKPEFPVESPSAAGEGAPRAAREAEAAPQDPVRGLTLERAVELAGRVHPDLAAAQARVEGAQGRALQAGFLPNPEAALRMEQARLEGRVTGKAEYLAGLSQAIPVGGRLSAARRVEELDRDRLMKELEARGLEVRTRVHAAFATALYLEQVVRAQRETFRAGEQGVVVAKARLAAGDAIPEEVARVEIELIRIRLDLERADPMRAVALSALAAEIGEPDLRIESLEGTLEVALELPSLESVSERLATHPLVTASELGIAAQKARMDLAEVERIPDVNLDLFYRRLEATDENAFDVGIRVDLPIFDRNQGRLREARAGLAEAQSRARSTRVSIVQELREAHAILSRALASARVLKDEILPRADTVLQGAEVRYAGGDLSLADILPIRRDRAGTQLNYLESLREVMTAWAKLAPYVRGK